ncbi:MerC mercury resistance protein [Alcanivorax sp. 521-1]|uniref:MerC mercury resistance protein n=1 Tax=Alloalcanivorax profundimaris TaxID=2735259 RepID=A0ABS0ALN3_9GAMM|nr:MerC domain-containing protein [Alloalcanivorax profundimaris]MBF5055039.1 MerC mercury resistance protein [Alloalcanivorax profundimaris]MBM1144809.1 MerC domain-containing protein [Alcanivorax sp. ZXX171]
MKDQLGTACSGLCIVHCLATPALVAAGGLGAVGGLLASKSFHLAMLAPVLLFAAASFPSAYRRHRHPGPGLLALAGVGLLIGAHLLPHALEALITSAGGLALIGAHLWNLHRHGRAAG